MPWYYQDRYGSTTGPVEELEVASLVSSGQIDRDTLVWTESGQWVRAESSAISKYFGPPPNLVPPPLPLFTIKNYWAFRIAWFPLVYVFFEPLLFLIFLKEFATTASTLAGKLLELNSNPKAILISLLLYMAINFVLAKEDQSSLKRQGITKAIHPLVGVLAPVYLALRGFSLRKIYGRGFTPFIPLMTWIACLVTGTVAKVVLWVLVSSLR